MFGIKTKKDKEIEKLRDMLDSMYFDHSHVITSHGNVITLGATQIIEDGMPAEYVKELVSRKLVKEALKFIHYDFEQHGSKNMLKGYIQVVIYGK